MKNINSATISGNLTRNAEMTNSAVLEILHFSVAVNEAVKDKDGNWSDRANYIDCVVFGRMAAALEQRLTKGTPVTVQGHLRWSQWENDGQKHSKVEIVADTVEVHGKREKQEAAPEPVYDAEIPF